MSLRTALLLAPLTISLAGCVTADSLNGELSKVTQESVGAVRVDTCPDKPSPPGAQFKTKLAVASVAPEVGDFGPAGGTNLSMGRDVILAAAKAGPMAAARPQGAALGVLLDMNLAQFVTEIDEIDADGVALANKTLVSKGLVDVRSAGEAASRIPDAQDAGEVVVDRSDWTETMRLVTQTTNRNGWTSAFVEELGKYVNAEKAGLTASERATQQGELQKKYLIAAYMLAYFRNGEVFSLDFNQASLKDGLKEKLKDSFKDEQLRKAAEAELDRFIAAYEKDLCKTSKTSDSCTLLGKIGEQTFVTRAGASHGFSGVTFTLDVGKQDLLSATKLDANVLAPDLVRVVIEAIGDEASQVPGVKTSTLCTVRPSRCATSAENEAMKRVNDTGDRVEAGTSAAVGAAIRGGWFFSLNNETLASTITTGVAVSVRKAAEAATWKAASGACPTFTAKGSAYRTIAFRLTE